MATSLHQDTWSPTVCGSFYLHPSSNSIESDDVSVKDTASIKLDVTWDPIDHKFVITCNHFSVKSHSTAIGMDAIKMNHELLVSAYAQLDSFLPLFGDSSYPATFECDNFPSFLSANNSDYNVTQIQPSDCKQLEMYFERVMTVIGVRPLLLLLFDDDPLAEFDEHIQEVKSRGLRNQLADAFRQLDQLSDLRATMCATTGAIDELINFHLMEDQVLININLILFELFNFKLNPFLELKECAGAKSRLVEQRLKSLHRSSTCSSLLEEQQLNGELQQLKSEAELLHDAIFQLYEQFYRQSTDLIFGQLTRMYQEAETVTLLNAGCSVKVATGTGSTSLVGATSSQSGSIGDDGDTLNSIRSAHGSRLLRLEIFYLQEKLKCLNVAKLSKLIERYRLKEMLDEAIAAHDQFNQVAIERLQVKVKNCEIRLIDARMAILNEEESLLKKQITYLQTCDDRHLTIDLDMLACFTLDDNNWDVESFERQFDACSDQIVLHLDYFKVKLRSLARKRAVFRTKRKLYIEEKKHNLGPKVTVGTLDSSCSTSSGVDMATSDTSSSNKSEQLRRSRVKALQRLRAFRRKQHASINNLTDVLLPHKHHHANDGSSCDRTSNRSTCSRTTGNNDSNALTNLTVSAHDSNNELNSLLFDSDFSSFSSNCSQPQGSFMATKNDVVKCNPNWISGCNNRELRNESDSTFPSHSGVIDGVILDTLDTTLDSVTDSDLLDPSYSMFESAKAPQPFLSLGVNPTSIESSLMPSSTLLTCKAMHLQAAKRKANPSPTNSFKMETTSRSQPTSSNLNTTNCKSFKTSLNMANTAMILHGRANAIKLSSQESRHDPLEEFQRIRSTLRKSVRKSSTHESTRTRDSLEPARKELTEIFQKIRNIKIN